MGLFDSIGSFFEDAVDWVGNTVEDVVDHGLPVISSVAAAIPGPWQIPALMYNMANALDKGNTLGVISSALGMGNVGGATSWFDAPVTDTAAMEAFTSMPIEAQNAYFNAGMSPLEVGKALVQDQAYMGMFQSLPVEAQQAYLNSGANPSAVGSAMMTDNARNLGLWEKLPAEAQKAYIDAGYSPTEIGGMLATDATVAGGSLSGVKTAFDAAKTVNKLFGTNTAGLLGTGANMLGSYLSGNAAKDAASIAAAAQVDAAKIAAEAAKFKPIGVTTRFGASNFGYDAAGNLKTAGYTLSPELKALQDQVLAAAPGMMSQFTGSQAATAPMGTAAQRAMMLGNQYLATDPQAQAAKYMADQQALLAGSREQGLASLQNKLAQQGRLGLATGATSTGMMATNPEMAAYQNAIQQQNLQLAANATQGGMDYAKFGADLAGTGGNLLNAMYGTQAASYAPFQTALGGAQTIEGLGQNALTQGISLGSTTTAANAASGNLLAQGMTNAARTMQPANAYSPWANPLGMFGDYLGSLKAIG